MSPVTADMIRKLTAGALSILVTVLLFRVMFRAAQGNASLADPELWVGLALLVLGFLWVKAARRVRGSSDANPTDVSPPKA